MRKILFFTQDRWAFGTIHHALEKELYCYDIYSNLIDWTKQYTLDEMQLLLSSYDFIVTNPEAVISIHTSYKIPLNRIIAIAHAQWDMLLAKDQNKGDQSFYEELHGFGVVSKNLISKAAEFGIKRIPEFLPIGIHYHLFERPPATTLQRVGYGGAINQPNFAGVDIKRGHLVKDIIQNNTPLYLVTHGLYIWQCMPAYYEKMDALAVSSSEESVGLPSMEAAAAGRMVLSTPVGYFAEYGPQGGGMVLSIEEEKYKQELINILKYYHSHPSEFAEHCKQIQKFAKNNYDWNCIHNPPSDTYTTRTEVWVNFLKT